MVVHFHVLITTQFHQLDALGHLILLTLHTPHQVVALSNPWPTLRMHLIDLQGLLDIFAEVIVSSKVDKGYGSAQVNICYFLSFFAIQFKRDAQGMLVEGDDFLFMRCLGLLIFFGVVDSYSSVNQSMKH
jgi:hypothetical protein